MAEENPAQLYIKIIDLLVKNIVALETEVKTLKQKAKEVRDRAIDDFDKGLKGGSGVHTSVWTVKKKPKEEPRSHWYN